MEFKDFGNIGYSAEGVLFWTSDERGIWVLLARRRMNSLLGSSYLFTIPTVQAKEGESPKAAAARAAHDELGLMPVVSDFKEFWEVEDKGVSMHLYAQRLSSAKKPKCRGSYADATWVLLSDDCVVEDTDSLLCDELKAFSSFVVKGERKVG